MIRDYLGNELTIGNEIVYFDRCLKRMRKGKITRLIKIKIEIDNNKLIFPCDCVKINDNKMVL